MEIKTLLCLGWKQGQDWVAIYGGDKALALGEDKGLALSSGGLGGTIWWR